MITAHANLLQDQILFMDMSESACNYNIEANTDDGSCEFRMDADENAINYNPEASQIMVLAKVKFMVVKTKNISSIIQKLILKTDRKTELDIGLKYLGGYIFELNYNNDGEPYGKLSVKVI